VENATSPYQEFQGYWLQYLLTKHIKDNVVEIACLYELMQELISKHKGNPEFVDFLYQIPGYRDHMTYLYDEHGDSSTYRQFLPIR
jgi:hypothetical protein